MGNAILICPKKICGIVIPFKHTCGIASSIGCTWTYNTHSIILNIIPNRANGHPDAWHSQIYPDMRRSIVCALLASQEAMDYSKENYYELFGADFMVSERLEIYLIEINSGPSMSSSTSVTARMCAQVLDDVNKGRFYFSTVYVIVNAINHFSFLI